MYFALGEPLITNESLVTLQYRYFQSLESESGRSHLGLHSAGVSRRTVAQGGQIPSTINIRGSTFCIDSSVRRLHAQKVFCLRAQYMSGSVPMASRH